MTGWFGYTAIITFIHIILPYIHTVFGKWLHSAANAMGRDMLCHV